MATLKVKIDNNWEEISVSSNIDDIYPIGTVYMSYKQILPAQQFGGSWARIENYFIRGSDNPIGTAGSSQYTLNTGGEDTVTLTISQIPSHTHTYDKPNMIQHTQTSGSGANYGYVSNGSWAGPASGARGGSGAHNNMPAYQDLYIWYRTA